jgi:mono/diheme cytochrome c family protein
MKPVFEHRMKSHAKAQRRKGSESLSFFANVALCVSLLLAPSMVTAADFDREIRPLLQERCVECHGPEKQKADLRLDAKPHAFKGGESGPAIIPAKSSTSPLFQRITASGDERMPPKGEPLTTDQISKIKAWIDSGAVWPENAATQSQGNYRRLHRSQTPRKRPLDVSPRR